MIPGDASSAVVGRACNCVELRYVVATFVPFHCTVAPLAKFWPLMMTGSEAVPATIEPGLRLPMKGAPPTTCKLALDDVPPPGWGLATNRLTGPRFDSSVSGTWVVILVALT